MNGMYVPILMTFRNGSVAPSGNFRPEASHDVVLGKVYKIKPIDWSKMYQDKVVRKEKHLKSWKLNTEQLKKAAKGRKT